MTYPDRPMEREEIERHDFPVGRRGYEQGAVDAHLRDVADEIERLIESRARAAGGHVAVGGDVGAGPADPGGGGEQRR